MNKANRLPLWLSCLLFLAAAALLSCFYTFCYRNAWLQNSDNIFWLRGAEAVLSGNLRLTGWTGGFYISPTSDFLWLVILRSFLSRQTALYITGPISYSLLVIFSWLLFCEAKPNSPIWQRVILILPLLFIPSTLATRMLSVGIHGISTMYTIVLFYLLARLCKKATWKSYLFFFFFMVFAGINDQWSVYFFCLPVLLINGFQLLRRFDREKLKIFLTTVVGTVFCVLIPKVLTAMHSIRIVDAQMGFIEVNKILDYLVMTLKTVLQLFMADFSNMSLFASDAIDTYKALLFLAVILIAIICWCRKPESSNLTDAALIGGIVICLGAYMFARTNKDLTPILTYLYPVYFFSVIFFGRWMLYHEFSSQQMRIAMLIPVVLFAWISRPKAVYPEPAQDTGAQAIVQVLKENGITRLYASYWQAYPIWYYSDGEIDAAPIAAYDGVIKGFHWTNNDRWFEPAYEAYAVVLSRQFDYAVTESLLNRQFGEYARHEDKLGLDFYYYDQNISAFIDPYYNTK